MNNDTPIRVLVADDHPIVRRGLKSLLQTEPGFECVGEAADGLQAVELTRALRPDVLMLDLAMPRMTGLEAIVLIKAEQPDARILVVTSFAEDDQVFPAIKAGAAGYLLKDAPPDMLLQAIRDVYRGESSLHPAIARKLMRELNQPAGNLPLTQDPLTEREMDVLRLLAQGLSNQDIAGRLSISDKTARFHVSHILSKLHLANRTQAALYARQEGIAADGAA